MSAFEQYDFITCTCPNGMGDNFQKESLLFVVFRRETAKFL